MAVDTTTVAEAFAALRSGNDIGGRHQLAALDTLCAQNLALEGRGEEHRIWRLGH